MKQRLGGTRKKKGRNPCKANGAGFISYQQIPGVENAIYLAALSRGLCWEEIGERKNVKVQTQRSNRAREVYYPRWFNRSRDGQCSDSSRFCAPSDYSNLQCCCAFFWFIQFEIRLDNPVRHFFEWKNEIYLTSRSRVCNNLQVTQSAIVHLIVCLSLVWLHLSIYHLPYVFVFASIFFLLVFWFLLFCIF